jgi:hypothetical protein
MNNAIIYIYFLPSFVVVNSSIFAIELSYFLIDTILSHFLIDIILSHFCYIAQSFLFHVVLSHSLLLQCSVIFYCYSAQSFLVDTMLSYFPSAIVLIHSLFAIMFSHSLLL